MNERMERKPNMKESRTRRLEKNQKGIMEGKKKKKKKKKRTMI